MMISAFLPHLPLQVPHETEKEARLRHLAFQTEFEEYKRFERITNVLLLIWVVSMFVGALGVVLVALLKVL